MFLFDILRHFEAIDKEIFTTADVTRSLDAVEDLKSGGVIEVSVIIMRSEIN